MKHDPNLTISLSSYVIGFGLSILLTLGAFWIAPGLGKFATLAVVAAALMQLMVQLIFFLHLGREPKPHWNLKLFSFTLLITGILIGGTLWIMRDLSTLHPRTPAEFYEDGIVSPENELH